MAALKSREWIDVLESRRLLSATLVDGTLTVLGTPLWDDIRVYRRPGPTDAPVYAVEIGPRDGRRPTLTWEFPLQDVRSVVVRSGSGDDVVDLGAATFPLPRSTEYGPLTVPSRVDSGIGNDRVYGGTSRDMIVDPFGNERIEGGQGDDWINAGWGRDVVHGGIGGDIVFGGTGNDFLEGGPGDDRLYGGSGDDVVHGDGGNDRLYGGAGNDWLGKIPFGPVIAEQGDDFLDGGDGVDRLLGGAGTDRMFGGPGRDVWLQGWSPVEQDAESERVDRTPDEPIERIPPTL